MIYTLVEDLGYDGLGDVVVLEGPSDVDFRKVHEEFISNFDHRKLGLPEKPEYKGPMLKYQSLPKIVTGSLYSGFIATPIASGCISSGDINFCESPDATSKEYQQWQLDCNKAWQVWDNKRKSKLEEFRVKYPPYRNIDTYQEGIWQMFITYICSELGFSLVGEDKVKVVII